MSGTSAGAIAAVTAITALTEVDVKIGEMASDILQASIVLFIIFSNSIILFILFLSN